MTKRKNWSRLARTRIFDAHKGICYLCEMSIYDDKKPWTLEHIKPLWLGGEDEESNLAPVHFNCGIEKTAAEAPVKAKTDRQRANHLGIKKPRSIRGWRKFNGGKVYASKER